MISRLLVIHPGALGDVLLALPAIRALRATYQGSEIILMASCAVGRLLKACSEIHRLIPLESSALSALLADDPVVPDWLSDALKGADVAVCWMADMDGRLVSSLQALGVREIVVKSPFQAINAPQHQADRFLASVRHITRPAEGGRPLRLPAEVLNEGRRMVEEVVVSGEGAVALHPGSGSRHKCCEPSLFAHAARTLSAAGYWPIVVGGPADDERVNGVEAQLSEFAPSATGLDLLSMAGLLAHVRLFVGHDSGLTHLAAALHRPTVSIFGPTCVQRWAPRGRHVRIVTGEACHCDGWEAVQACRQKPCLRVPERHLLEACEALLTHDSDHVNPCSIATRCLVQAR